MPEVNHYVEKGERKEREGDVGERRRDVEERRRDVEDGETERVLLA